MVIKMVIIITTPRKERNVHAYTMITNNKDYFKLDSKLSDLTF